MQLYRDLTAYKKAFAIAMQIFEITKTFPRAETYSLIDQIRRSSRSVCVSLEKHIESGFIVLTGFQSVVTQIWKTLKLKFGLTFHLLSNTLRKVSMRI